MELKVGCQRPLCQDTAQTQGKANFDVLAGNAQRIGRVEVYYLRGFADPLMFYTPSLDRCSRRGSNSSIPGVVSLPLFKGEGTPPVAK